MNLDSNGKPLTFPEYIYLIKRDMPDQLEVLGKPIRKPIKEVEYNRPHPKYDGLILKRVGDVVCLSNGLVKYFGIGTPCFAFFKLYREELYVQFSNLDSDIATIQYKINLTRYARRPLVDGSNFPCLIYFKLTDVLDNGQEYEVNAESVLIEGNRWYLVSWQYKKKPKKAALKQKPQPTTVKARGRQEPAYALISLIQLLYVSSSGRQA